MMLGQQNLLTEEQLQLDALEIFSDEGSLLQTGVGAGGIVVSVLALMQGFRAGTEGVNFEQVSIGLLSGGGSLMLMQNDRVRNAGRWILGLGIVYEGAARTGLLDRFIAPR